MVSPQRLVSAETVSSFLSSGLGKKFANFLGCSFPTSGLFSLPSSSITYLDAVAKIEATVDFVAVSCLKSIKGETTSS